jgi:hypothetical protein
MGSYGRKKKPVTVKYEASGGLHQYVSGIRLTSIPYRNRDDFRMGNYTPK